MGAYQKAAPLTFDAAVQRIRDSLDQLDRIGETIDAWQSDTLARALAHLQMGNYALSMDAAFRACRPLLYKTKAATIAFGDGPVVTVRELRAELDRVVAEIRESDET